MFHLENFPENKKEPFRVLRVGFDLDDTFFDISAPSLKILNETYDLNLIYDDITEFWYMQAFLKQIGVPKEEVSSFFDELYRSPDDPHRVYRDSLPIFGAIGVLSKIYSAGHIPLVLTTRPPGLEKIIEEQFKMAGIDWVKDDWVEGGNILIRDDYYWQRMSGEEFKLRAIKGDFPDGKYRNFPGLDVHFDDMGELFQHPMAAEIRDKIYILAHRYNQDVSQENLVHNWWVFYKIVRCIARDEDLSWLTSHNVDRPVSSSVN